MPQQTLDTPRPMLLSARNPNQLSEVLRRDYGDGAAEILERTGTKRLSLGEQQNIVNQLKTAGLNGNADRLLEAYQLHRGEMAKKEIVQDRWYHTLGRGVKNVMLAPFRAIGWGFKNHPILTTAGLAGLAAYLAYAFGIPLAQFAGEGGDERTRGIAETMRRVTRFPPGGDMPGTGEVPVPTPQYPEISPPSIPIRDR